jgi:hypothetical protein
MEPDLKELRDQPAKRELGWARGEFTVPENFDDPLPRGY